jgi:hypothetical protein
VCGLLAEKGTALGGPWSDHLAHEVWELRLRRHRLAVRLTYWCTPEGTVVFLTVFHKTRQHEQKQIERAVRAQQICAREHRRPAVDDIECIEEGGTEPTVALLRRLAAALDADVRLTPGHDLGSVGFETHAA